MLRLWRKVWLPSSATVARGGSLGATSAVSLIIRGLNAIVFPSTPHALDETIHAAHVGNVENRILKFDLEIYVAPNMRRGLARCHAMDAVERVGKEHQGVGGVWNSRHLLNSVRHRGSTSIEPGLVAKTIEHQVAAFGIVLRIRSEEHT